MLPRLLIARWGSILFLKISSEKVIIWKKDSHPWDDTRLGFIESVHEQLWLMQHCSFPLGSFSGTTANDLVDPNWPGKYNLHNNEVRADFYGHHTAFNTSCNEDREILKRRTFGSKEITHDMNIPDSVLLSLVMSLRKFHSHSDKTS